MSKASQAEYNRLIASGELEPCDMWMPGFGETGPMPDRYWGATCCLGTRGCRAAHDGASQLLRKVERELPYIERCRFPRLQLWWAKHR